MGKTSRNQPCPCGSGKKYKRCCLSQDQAAEIEAAQHRPEAQIEAATASLPPGFVLEEGDEFTELSNRAVDLIHDRRLAEAEEVCRELKDRFPDRIDWIERTAMLHEARGEAQKALHYYRRCLDYIEENHELFEQASRDSYRQRIDRLEAETQETPEA